MNERSIFAAALDITDPAARAAYLDEACGHQPGLRVHFDELLAAQAKLGSFLARPPVVPPGTQGYEPEGVGPGSTIGPYKLLQQIGEGGMGVVYMAEQEQPVRRRVALKIVKSGLDSTQVIARFEAERQALALMDHPNIAKVLDAGTIESSRHTPCAVADGTRSVPATLGGRPYFVMELVKGIPITAFCDENQLTPRQRLELFIPVCHAVQHAHQKGVIHRDLKPSNVLVALYDDQPVPKVIDFGVAKATSQKLTERTLFTAFGSFVGTLEYMSPEQAKLNALDIDTRSDIYALGVLLYELLTGNTPLERARLGQTALDELLRIIREEEPPRPSTRLSQSGEALATISARRRTEPAKLGQVLRGELDWIVMKALEKDRTRRYETANGLARDLQHYLADEPVEACPPTAGYKLRKFARKNKKLLATAAAFAALLLLGVAASAWQAARATRAEAVALANERQATANAVQAQEKEQEANQQRDEAQQQRDEVRALNDQLRRTTYAAHMNLAQHAWDAGGAVRALDLLEQHRPRPGEADLRGFEWHYLNRLCHADLLTLKVEGHTSEVRSVAFSPDGKRLAGGSGGLDDEQGNPVPGAVKVWDAQTGRELLTLKGHTGRIQGVAFRPDGKRLASASQDRTVKVWDAQTGQELLTLKGHTGPVFGVAFSPDGQRLASGSGDRTVRVWDAQTGQETLTLKGHTSAVMNEVAFSPDGQRLASTGSGDQTVKVWNARTGQELLTLKGHRGFVYGVAYSPDGRRLASAAEDQTVKVWDAQSGQELLSLKGHTAKVWRVAYSPDGQRLASGSSDQTVKVWDAQSGQDLFTLKGHAAEIRRLVYSPDGKRLASVSLDGIVKVWGAQPDPETRTLKGHSKGVTGLAFSPDGKRLASGSGDGTVKVWDAQTGQETRTLNGHSSWVDSVAFSPDGKRLASCGGLVREGGVKVWDAQTGQELLSFKGHTGPVVSVVFSPDGQRLASASWDRTVKVWDAQTGQELLTLKGHTGIVWSAVFSPDGKRLASASGNQVKVWDAQTGQELRTLKGGGNSVAFSPDGKQVASDSEHQTVRVWDAQTGRELLTLKGHTNGVSSVAFSPDGKRLASASVDQTVKLWDAQTGQELLTLKGHTHYVHSVAFSPNGHWLASGSHDGTVKIYDATPLPQKP